MTKHKLTRRKALCLGLGSCASVTMLPMIGRGKNFDNRLLAQEAIAPIYEDFTVSPSAALKELAAAKELIYGVASQQSILNLDQQFASAIALEGTMLMADTDLLWMTLHPEPQQYNFESGDRLAEFTQRQKMLLGGTHLVWDMWMPDWVEKTVNPQNAQEILLDHIKTVVEHYAGKVHLWTVVNEATYPPDGRSDGLRDTIWLEMLGSDYIEIAFRAAAEADPNALLVYNDYGLEYDYPDQEAKRIAVLRLLENLKSKGVPINAFGLQTHVWYDTKFDLRKLQNFLKDVADLGLNILVTEMDVSDRELPVDIQVRDRLIAGVYQDILSVILDEPAVIGVNTWGLSDRYSWLFEAEPRPDGAPVRPLPLDSEMNRKLAWNAVANAFNNTTKRETSKLWNAWKKLQDQA